MPGKLGLAIALLLALVAGPLLAQGTDELPERSPDLKLTGTITGADHQSYVRAPFALPEGTERLVVAFGYDARGERTTIDLGVEDPNGFRGASGGNKASFTIAATDATPSYLAGPLPPGEWALALAVPNIRQGVTSTWTAQVWFLRGAEAQWRAAPPADRGPGWYRGDLHLHTAQSDGSCDSRTGKRVPCPAYRTLEAAAARGLDFLALTEHNTTSQAAATRELSPYFDDLLLIPGREITTFFGHFNIFGVSEFIDYRIAPGIDNSFASIAARVHELGGIVSINHPRLPSGEACMGCGWTMPGMGPSDDLAMVDAVEVANGASSAAGGGPEGPVAGLPFWLEALAAGNRLAAIGSSDNHDPALAGPGAVGMATTVVEASALTTAAILEGIRQGRTFVDLTGTDEIHLDFSASAGGSPASMGASLPAHRGATITLKTDIRAPAGTSLEVLYDTQVVERRKVDEAMSAPSFLLPAELGLHTLWLKLRDNDDALLATSSAIVLAVE